MLHRRTEQTLNVKFLAKLRKVTPENFDLLREAYGVDVSSYLKNTQNDFRGCFEGCEARVKRFVSF